MGHVPPVPPAWRVRDGGGTNLPSRGGSLDAVASEEGTVVPAMDRGG